MPPREVPERARRAGWTLAIVGWILFVGASLEVFRARADPKRFAAPTAAGWFVASTDWAAAAQQRLESGLRLLNDSSRPASERIRGYRDELTAAERLLLRAVRACPTQASALAQLAAVRWELGPPLGDDELQRHLELIDVAARVAPNTARVRVQLGELLLQMGLTEPAMTYLRSAVELAPDASRDVVTVLQQQLFTATKILDELPHLPPVLIAVYEAFADEASEPQLLSALEDAIDADSATSHPTLLICYARTSLKQGLPRRLLAGLDRLGPLRQSSSEAMRLQQRSRALLSLGDLEGARQDADTARALAPESDRLAEYSGDLRLQQGDAPGALHEFREALRLLARGSGDPVARARLYRKCGQAEEQRGATDRAYDAYLRAVALDPDEPHATERLRSMRAAAGIGP